MKARAERGEHTFRGQIVSTGAQFPLGPTSEQDWRDPCYMGKSTSEFICNFNALQVFAPIRPQFMSPISLCKLEDRRKGDTQHAPPEIYSRSADESGFAHLITPVRGLRQNTRVPSGRRRIARPQQSRRGSGFVQS